MHAMRTFPLDPTVNEDLFHDALVKFIRICRQPNDRGIQNRLAYLTRMFHVACMDRMRSQKKMPQLTSYRDPQPTQNDYEPPAFVSESEQSKIEAVISAVLERIDKENLRDCFRILLEQEKQNRLAAEKGRSPARLNYRLKRTLAELRFTIFFLFYPTGYCHILVDRGATCIAALGSEEKHLWLIGIA